MTGKQLRNSILQWAIQGKLVPQDPNDEPASVLLERIREEKTRLVKEKKIKRDKNETIIYRGEDNSYYEKNIVTGSVKCIDDEIPFDIPQGWEWTRLNELALYRKGPFGSSLTKSMFVPKSDDSVKVYEQKNAIQKDWKLGDYYISKDKYSSMSSFAVYPNDIIVSCAGTIGETYLIPEDATFGIINQALMKVSLFDLSMAKYWQLIFEYILIVDSKMKGAGSAIKNIPPFEVLKAFLVPIPPINEQNKIIERFENIVSHIERYQISALHLDRLNKDIQNLLKKSILQEAIQGKLVPQTESEGTAEELLEEIRAEKQRLVKEGKLKASAFKAESRIFRGDDNKYYEQIGANCTDITDFIPYEIPTNWKWCRLSNVIQLLSGRDLEPTEYNDSRIGIPYMTGASNFCNEKLQINRWTDKPQTISVTGDLLITCKGTIGQMAFNTIGEIHIARQIMAIRGIFFCLQYVKYFLESMIDTLQKQAKSMIPGISREVLLNALFPLPPIEEQQRISRRLEEISKMI